jgi:hypothetical protein
MKLFQFTFKREAVWMMILSLAIPLIGMFRALVVWLAR